jgi:Predicted protein tyrosine phosphatase
VLIIKILFLCSQNRRRSLTAEKIFNSVNGHEVRSAGTENNSRVKVTAGLLGWADVIFCMEKKHMRRVKDKYYDIVVDKKLICLNIPDEYEYMEEALIDILKASVDEYL